MRLAVGHAVRRAVVTSRAAHRHAHRRSGLEGLIELRHRLAGPVGFGRAPADRDHRWLVHAVVHGHRDRVEEAFVGVRREVHGDRGLGCDSRSDLDVEHHLAIGALCIRRVIGPTIDTDGLDGGHRQSQAREVGLDVGRPESTTQLDDGDALARPIQPGRELVERGQLRRGERTACGAGGHLVIGVNLKMGLCLWPVVQSEDALDHLGQVARHADRTRAAAVSAAVVLELLQADPEGLAHGGRIARQHHAAPRGIGINQDQLMLGGKGRNLGDVLCIGTVAGGVAFATQVLALGRALVAVHAAGSNRAGRCLRAQPNRDFEALV